MSAKMERLDQPFGEAEVNETMDLFFETDPDFAQTDLDDPLLPADDSCQEKLEDEASNDDQSDGGSILETSPEEHDEQYFSETAEVENVLKELDEKLIALKKQRIALTYKLLNDEDRVELLRNKIEMNGEFDETLVGHLSEQQSTVDSLQETLLAYGSQQLDESRQELDRLFDEKRCLFATYSPDALAKTMQAIEKKRSLIDGELMAAKQNLERTKATFSRLACRDGLTPQLQSAALTTCRQQSIPLQIKADCLIEKLTKINLQIKRFKLELD